MTCPRWPGERKRVKFTRTYGSKLTMLARRAGACAALQQQRTAAASTCACASPTCTRVGHELPEGSLPPSWCGRAHSPTYTAGPTWHGPTPGPPASLPEPQPHRTLCCPCCTCRDYVHRVGRTARAGREGWALSLVSQYDVKLVHSIEGLIGHQLQARGVAGHRVPRCTHAYNAHTRTVSRAHKTLPARTALAHCTRRNTRWRRPRC